ERDFGPFRRAFDLPGPADLSKTEASLRAGLLCLRVPRIVDRRGRPRPIEVRVVDGHEPGKAR
ncbi:MAG TPA: Hsp20/alpha crystallin family protein, partial [Polyangia bacterium]